MLYQPLDGSTPHALFNPAPETINDFDWSPSGKQLAVARVKSSSDVVLITDQAGKVKKYLRTLRGLLVLTWTIS